MLPTLSLTGDAATMGRAHGARFRDSIRRFAAERTAMLGQPLWAGRPLARQAVLDIVEQTIPAHERYDAALMAEVAAMADATGLSLAETLVVSGFTDLVDTVYNQAGDYAPAPVAADQCTAMLVPGRRAAAGHALFAQTWDMHESAVEHVLLIEGRPADAPDFTVFTSMGCPGMIGMNAHGITVGINNLTAIDGGPGVTWNLVVRKVLQQSSFEAALACITDAPLAGAHNYLLLDGTGRGANIEAMPGARVVTELAATPLIHTNHCLTEAARRVERERPAITLASSERRLARAQALLAAHDRHDFDSLAGITADAEAICVQPTAQVREATCGAVIADPANRRLWAVRDSPDADRYRMFRVGR